MRESLSEVRGRVHILATKTGERRTVPLPRFLCAILDEHIERFPAKDGYVFTSPDGGVLRCNVYMRHFKPAVRAGLDERSGSTTFATRRRPSPSMAGPT